MNLSGDFHSFRLFKKGTFSFTEKVPYLSPQLTPHPEQ